MGVLCDCRIFTELKGKFYRTAIRSAMLYCIKCWATKKQHASKMSAVEMSMLRWMCGKALRDTIRDDKFHGMANRIDEREQIKVVWTCLLLIGQCGSQEDWFSHRGW